MKTLRITVATGSITDVLAPAVVVNHFRQVHPSGAEAAINNALGDGICKAIADGKFVGRQGETLILPSSGKIAANHAVVVGLGDFGDFAQETLTTVVAAMVLAAIQLKLDRFATIVHGGGLGLPVEELAETLIADLVSTLNLLDPGGRITEVILCDLNADKTQQIAKGAQDSAKKFKRRINIQVQQVTIAPTGQPAATAGEAAATYIAPPPSPATTHPSPVPIYIDISARNNLLYYRILDRSNPLLQIQKKQLSHDFMVAMTREMNRVATGQRQSTDVYTDLRNLGTLAYSQLLNRSMQERIRNYAAGPLVLILDKTTVAIPWEIIHDGQDFLCRKFALGRNISTEGTGASPHGCAITSPVRMLLVANPTGDLPGAEEEGKRLQATLSEGTGIIVEPMHQVTSIALLERLNSGQYQFLHYAGHAHFDPAHPTRSAWILADGEMTAEQIGSLNTVPSLVFANACESGATAEWQGDYSYEGRTYGLASAFLLAGVSNYIGTFWPVHDEASVHFATIFYNQVLAGLSLGEAMQAARDAVINLMGWNELAWAGYMLYGDPTFQLM